MGRFNFWLCSWILLILHWILYCLGRLCSKLQVIDMWPSLANYLCSDWTLSSSLWYPLYQAQCNRSTICFFFLFIYLFPFGYPGSSLLACAFSSCGQWGSLFLTAPGFLLVSLLRAPACRLQQLQHVGSRAGSQDQWSTVLVVLWQVDTSWTRDQTCLSWGKILIHCTTREVLNKSFWLKQFLRFPPTTGRHLQMTKLFCFIWALFPGIIIDNGWYFHFIPAGTSNTVCC